MHTAVCTFDDRAQAERAVERLVEAGFDRRDVHLEYRHADGSPMRQENDAWDGLEREVAVDRRVVERLGDFFGRLFGRDDGAGHGGTYVRAVERGHCVVVVDGHSDAEGDRAQAILHGMEARDMNLVHRPEQRPLREIVADRQATMTGVTTDMEQTFGTARSEMGDNHNREVRREGEFPRERALAAGSMASSQGWGEQRTLELRDQPEPQDVERAPGLRHAPDRDKPGR